MTATQNPFSVTKGICAKLPITAKAHKIAETIKTTVDGADRVISPPLLLTSGL
jgi:hypothetical protein